MIVKPIITNLIKVGDDLFETISRNIKELPERSVLVVTSKIISVCEGRIIEKKTEERSEKHKIVKKEADLYINPTESKYDIMLTIKNNILAVNAGIDESNANEHFILWPKDIQKKANSIWKFLRLHYKVNKVGVIITDSKTFPLKWGIVGTSIASCGFKGLFDYRGKKDIFGRILKMSQINVAEALAVSAVFEMGEADEKMPLCLITDIPKIEFQSRIPSKKELNELLINIKDDVYAPVLTKAKWRKGNSIMVVRN